MANSSRKSAKSDRSSRAEQVTRHNATVRFPCQTSNDRPSANRRRSRTAISFNPSVSVKFVPTLDEMTDDEYLASFYTPDDYRNLQEGVVESVKALRRNEQSECNFRGIEHMKCLASMKARKLRKQTIVKAVIYEQNHQEQKGIYDPEAIAQVAAELSESSKIDALRKGNADSREVRNMFSSRFVIKSYYSNKKSETSSNMPPIGSVRRGSYTLENAATA